MASVVSAAANANAVPDEAADDGAALAVDSVLITASVPVSVPAIAATPVVTPTQQPASSDAGAAPPAPAAPNTTAQNQRLFLPVVKNLSGAALSSPGGLGVLVLVVLGLGGVVLQRRRLRTGR